ncbi:MAG TPA: hypothetical protein PKU89_03790, partial [Kiritimatiellia bacterium]|nr:hypothetical protein [Kiritimatiellia bacterium]
MAIAKSEQESTFQPGQQIGQILIAVETDGIVTLSPDIGRVDEEKSVGAVISLDALESTQAFNADLGKTPVDLQKGFLDGREV